MRRADRLIELARLLRPGEIRTATHLAATLEVHVRTVYRDIASLQARGFPIEGEAGVGYTLRAPIHLPPLTFDFDELEALFLGLHYAADVGDPALSAAARTAQGKIAALGALRGKTAPAALRARARGEAKAPASFAKLRFALRERREISFAYRDRRGAGTHRRVQPLALSAFEKGWLLIAWCLLRDDFRVFRVDFMGSVTMTERQFVPSPGRDLPAYLARARGDGLRTAGEGNP